MYCAMAVNSALRSAFNCSMTFSSDLICTLLFMFKGRPILRETLRAMSQRCVTESAGRYCDTRNSTSCSICDIWIGEMPPFCNALLSWGSSTLFSFVHSAMRALAASSDCLYTSMACRSEEHTSELQSLRHLVCRLLLEKKKTN